MITEKIKTDLEVLVKELGGTVNYLSTYDSRGQTSQKIVIEYDRKSKGQ
tara:strand:- start:314 stop:460 length:147 start_codon:yes stop_codon:yes gene_type:complete